MKYSTIILVGPGYEDTAVRPWNKIHTQQRENGDYYSIYFQKAISLRHGLLLYIFWKPEVYAFLWCKNFSKICLENWENRILMNRKKTEIYHRHIVQWVARGHTNRARYRIYSFKSNSKSGFLSSLQGALSILEINGKLCKRF